MSQPPYRPQGEPQPNWEPQGPYPRPDYRQGGQAGYGQTPYGQPQYGQTPPAQAPRSPAPRQAPQPQQQRPSPPPRPSAPSGPLRLPGLGLILTLLGTVVSILSLTVLPWVAAGGSTQSLYELWDKVSSGGAHSFSDWYVILFSYPLPILGILLAFAAVLESVAMKIVWAGLMLLGVGYLLLRYGLGPVTGVFGADTAAGFGTGEIVVAVVAVAAVVLVVFTLKTAVSMFRRVAGLVLMGLSGVHIFAVMDLVKAADISDLDLGAFGPSLGYLLIGVAALVGPRRLIPGL